MPINPELIKSAKEYAAKYGVEVTCEKCVSKDSCQFAYDWYNTDGDCLANK